jgi:hypothetical protein
MVPPSPHRGGGADCHSRNPRLKRAGQVFKNGSHFPSIAARILGMYCAKM